MSQEKCEFSHNNNKLNIVTITKYLINIIIIIIII
jgi:hypothetical protein